MGDSVDNQLLSVIKRSSLVLDYDILEQLGAGGFGTVVKARHRTLDRLVAIKVVPVEPADEEVLKRFTLEAQILSRITNPHIAAVYAYGELDGKFAYLVMEYLGGPLLDKLAGVRDGVLLTVAPDRGLKMFTDCVRALCALQTEGIVHRDIKPNNIVLTSPQTDHVKLVDFGLSKHLTPERTEQALTAEHATVGTPAYMSPEQCHGANLDSRSDIYSLACVMFELLTGVPPFEAETAHEVLAMHFVCKPPLLVEKNPALKRWPLLDEVQKVLSRCLEKEPGARYETPQALLVELSSLTTKKPAYHVSRWSILAALAACIICAYSFWVLSISPKEPIAGTSRFWHIQYADMIVRYHRNNLNTAEQDRFDFLANKAIEMDKVDHLLTPSQSSATFAALEFSYQKRMEKARTEPERRKWARCAQVNGVEYLKIAHQFASPESVLLHCAYLMNYMETEMVHEDVIDQAAQRLKELPHSTNLMGHFGPITLTNFNDESIRLAKLYLRMGMSQRALTLLRDLGPKRDLAHDQYIAASREAMVYICNDMYSEADSTLEKPSKQLRSLKDDQGALSLLFRTKLADGKMFRAKGWLNWLRNLYHNDPDKMRRLDLLWQAKTGDWKATRSTLDSLVRPTYTYGDTDTLGLFDSDMRLVAKLATAAGQTDIANMAVAKISGQPK